MLLLLRRTVAEAEVVGSRAQKKSQGLNLFLLLLGGRRRIW